MACFLGICWAENDSEQLALGYSNRSAVYCEWNQWNECLENIEMARKYKDLSDDLKLKLEKRELLSCKEFLRMNENSDDENDSAFLNLTYSVHERVPFIADCLELAENEKYGRHIITKRDLNIGDVIIAEKPLMLSLNVNSAHVRCLNCASENKYSLIPCLYCTQAMFCNEKCRDDAFQAFHKFECNVIDGLYDVLLSTEMAAIRLVLKLFTNYDNITKIIDYIETEKEKSMNVFTIDHSETSVAEQYKAVHSLSILETQKTGHNEIFNVCISAAAAITFLKQNEHIQKIFENPKHKEVFHKLVLHNFQTTVLNSISHFIHEQNMDGTTSQFTDYADGIYSCTSLLNHSCLPNVFINFSTDKQQNLVFVQRQISAGEPISVNYLS